MKKINLYLFLGAFGIITALILLAVVLYYPSPCKVRSDVTELWESSEYVPDNTIMDWADSLRFACNFSYFLYFAIAIGVNGGIISFVMYKYAKRKF